MARTVSPPLYKEKPRSLTSIYEEKFRLKTIPCHIRRDWRNHVGGVYSILIRWNVNFYIKKLRSYHKWIIVEKFTGDIIGEFDTPEECFEFLLVYMRF